MVIDTKMFSQTTTASLSYNFTGNVVSSIPILRPLLSGLLNLPELSNQACQGATAIIPPGLKLNGRGGLIELLNSVLGFVSGLFISTPKLLSGLPLSKSRLIEDS